MNDNCKDIERKLQELSDYVYKGDDITLPLNIVSTIVEDIKSKISLQEKKIEELSRMHNQAIYMFLTLLITVLGKALLQYLIG